MYKMKKPTQKELFDFFMNGSTRILKEGEEADMMFDVENKETGEIVRYAYDKIEHAQIREYYRDLLLTEMNKNLLKDFKKE